MGKSRHDKCMVGGANLHRVYGSLPPGMEAESGLQLGE